MKKVIQRLVLLLVALAFMGAGCSFDIDGDGEELNTVDAGEVADIVEPTVSDVDSVTEEEITALVDAYYAALTAGDTETMLATVHPLELEVTPANLWIDYWTSQFTNYGIVETYAISGMTSEEFPDGSFFVTAAVDVTFPVNTFSEELTYAKLPGEAVYLLSELSSIPQ